MPNVRFKVVVVGSGIAGLACATCLAQKGHDVLVLERKPDLSEFGAGIQISANGVRPLLGWDMKDLFEEVAYKPGILLLKRFDTGKVIGKSAYNYESTAEINYGQE